MISNAAHLESKVELQNNSVVILLDNTSWQISWSLELSAIIRFIVIWSVIQVRLYHGLLLEWNHHWRVGRWINKDWTDIGGLRHESWLQFIDTDSKNTWRRRLSRNQAQNRDKRRWRIRGTWMIPVKSYKNQCNVQIVTISWERRYISVWTLDRLSFAATDFFKFSRPRIVKIGTKGWQRLLASFRTTTLHIADD